MIRIQASPVERVSHLGNQSAGGIPRQAGVRIQRDHIAHRTRDCGWLPIERHEAGIGGAAQQAVQLMELAPLALPPHPAALAGVELAMAMEQQETIASRPRAMFAVQLGNGLTDVGQQGVVIGHDRLVGIHTIAEQRKREVATDP
ncbi:hypothetical protein D3C78_670970 [compost metagenome]